VSEAPSPCGAGFSDALPLQAGQCRPCFAFHRPDLSDAAVGLAAFLGA
jgi:hypothetical protein